MTGIKARPTLYKGIQMRSRLEADYAAHLDSRGLKWEYEPTCFAGGEGQWLPDFGYAPEDGPLDLFEEVKPAGSLAGDNPRWGVFAERVDAVLRRMTIAWESNPGAALRLVFWQYGGPEYLSVSSARQGLPWVAQFNGQPWPLIWSGMDQMKVVGGDRANGPCETDAKGAHDERIEVRPAGSLAVLHVFDGWECAEVYLSAPKACELAEDLAACANEVSEFRWERPAGRPPASC